MFSDSDKAYLAGYVDAEGCIGVYKATRAWFASVSLKQTQPVVIDEMLSSYGGSTCIETPSRGRPYKKWQLVAIDDVRRFLTDVTPYLREKREQAEIVLNEFDPKADHGTNLILHDRLGRLKAKQLQPVGIQSRLAIAAHDPDRKCFDCGEPAFARGFCAKHYQKAKREKRFTANIKGEGVPFTYGRVLQALDAPYFAGYFDGDGSLMLRPEKNRWYPRVAFGQTQPDAVIDLHLIYGGSLKFIKGKGVNPKPILFYQLTQRQAVLALLRDIQPFSVEKHDQINTFLNTYQPNMSFEDGQVLQRWL